MENETAEPRELLAGKFKSVDALLHAYEELEAEFTRRSQKLKALEETDVSACKLQSGEPSAQPIPERGVTLLGGEGVGVTAPAPAPKNIREAGLLALGYFKKVK